MNARKVVAALSAFLALQAGTVSGDSQSPTTASASTPAAVTSAAAAPPSQARPPRIGVDVFAKRPTYSGMILSPLGTQALARATVQGKERLVVIELSTGKVRVFGSPDKSDLVGYGWAGEHRILVGFGASVRWFDDEAYATRLIAFDLRTSEPTLIGRKGAGLRGDDVLYVDDSGEWLLLALQGTPYEYPSVYRVDLASGAMKRVVDAQAHVWDWYADSAGVVRTGLGHRPGSWFMVYRKTADEDFRRVRSEEYRTDAPTLEKLRVTPESDQGFALSDERTGRFALHRFNFATGTLGDVVFQSPANDIDDYDVAIDGKSIVSASYVDDQARTAWIDPVLQGYQDRLDMALPGRMNHIVSHSRDRSRFIVWSGGSNDPGTYYLFVPGTNEFKRIAVLHEGLDPTKLPISTYARYKARDGLEIPAYLTLPLGREPKGLPLVVMPHGGPYGVRDMLEYNPEVQFLANRGYAVLQPNFRGSAGYGADFYQQGQGQLGRRMQDDLDDGVEWLVGRGIVDPRRVCLVGASYGGYAALWGATRNPERYRCAASLAGVTDVGRQLKYQLNMIGDRRRQKDWRATVEGEKGFELEGVSPLHKVAELRVPVLVVHGDADQRVPVRQAVWYEAALKKAGKQYEYKIYAGEGHGFDDPANFADWLGRLEAFLAKNNPAD